MIIGLFGAHSKKYNDVDPLYPLSFWRFLDGFVVERTGTH